jgi:pyruvate formate lyase activating enzyme
MSWIPDIVGINPVAEAGFPDVICPVVFLAGCNLRCSYCLNSSIVSEKPKSDMTVDGVLEYLKENEEDTILVSGGEPCMSESLLPFVRALVGGGISVRLATNGSFPRVVNDLILNGLISFVALDIKFDVFSDRFPDDVAELVGTSDVSTYANNVRDSVDLMEAHSGNGKIGCEYRTTLYPPLIGEREIRGISHWLGREATWVLQQYRDADGCGFGGAKAKPYGRKTVDELLGVAKALIHNTYLREP